MSNRLVAFVVEHPQLEIPPGEMRLGRKKAQIMKNLASPALMLGAVNAYSPCNSPVKSPPSPYTRGISPDFIHQPTSKNRSVYDLLYKFPKYTKAHPKFSPSSPIVDIISPHRRLGSLGTHIVNNRNSIS